MSYIAETQWQKMYSRAVSNSTDYRDYLIWCISTREWCCFTFLILNLTSDSDKSLRIETVSQVNQV